MNILWGKKERSVFLSGDYGILTTGSNVDLIMNFKIRLGSLFHLMWSLTFDQGLIKASYRWKSAEGAGHKAGK